MREALVTSMDTGYQFQLNVARFAGGGDQRQAGGVAMIRVLDAGQKSDIIISIPFTYDSRLFL